MGRHRASQPRGGLKQRARLVLLVVLAVVTVVLWSAAFFAAARDAVPPIR